MGAIKSFCTSSMLLDGGHLAFAESVDGAVDAYCALMAGSDISQMGVIPETPRPWSTSEARLRFVSPRLPFHEDGTPQRSTSTLRSCRGNTRLTWNFATATEQPSIGWSMRWISLS